MTLEEFRLGLEEKMQEAKDLRLFVCDGSPLSCQVFIVGFNSATALGQPFFERYWNDTVGFRRAPFEADYLATRKKRGVRPRIEAFVEGLSPLRCLETNIYATPTKKANELRADQKDSTIFNYLVESIRPAAIVAHSNEPVRLLEGLAGGVEICGNNPVQVNILGVPTLVLGLRGPLFRRRVEDLLNLGLRIRQAVEAQVALLPEHV